MKRSALALLIVPLLAAPGVRAQDRAQDEPPTPEQQDSVEPARLRARLERRLEEIRTQEQRLRDALDRLDQGASASEILRDVPVRELWGKDADSDSRGPSERRADRDGPGEPMGNRRERGGHGGPPGLPSGTPDHDGPPRATVEEVQRFLDEFAPRLAERIRHVREESPPMADRMLERMRPRIGELLATKRDDPSFFEVRRDDFLASVMVLEAGRELSAARRSGDEARIGTAREQARGAVAASVDARRRVQEAELARLERRLQSLREEIAKDAERRDAIIEERVKEMEAHTGREPEAGPPRRERPPR